MSLDPGNRFIVGINNAWFDGQYDHDLGYNQFSISRLYDNPIPNPSAIDPNPPKPYISENPTELSSFFSNVQTQQKNLQLVRVWLFERFEGIIYDNNNNITGLDNTFQQNIISLLDAANQNGIKIYFCLLDPWGIYDTDMPTDLPSTTKPSDYTALQSTWKSLVNKLITDNSTLNSFLNNSLKPLLGAIATHPALFAIDLMNEPEGFTSNDTSISFSNIQNYLTLCSNFIHGYNSSIKVSCGFQNAQTIFGNIAGLAPVLDFFDFHTYEETITQQSAYQAASFANKPCLIGECGYRSSTPPGDPTQELPIIQNLMTSYTNGGFAGCLPWISYAVNSSAITDYVKSYADTLPMVSLQSSQQSSQQSQQQATGKCFIATASMGSELHPHVQSLREFRDDILLQSRYRKTFENLLEKYYRFSPPIASAMNKNSFLKTFLKYTLVYPVVFGIKIILPVTNIVLGIERNVKKKTRYRAF